MKISVIKAFELWPYLGCMFMPGLEGKLEALHNPIIVGDIKDVFDNLRKQCELILESQPSEHVEIPIDVFLKLTHLNGSVEIHFSQTGVPSLLNKQKEILNQVRMFVKVLTTMERLNPQIREAEDNGLMEIFRNMQKGNDQ